MGLFQDITSAARTRKLDFLVVGGLAVIFYGHSGDTADLDLLIRRDQRGEWLNLLSQLDYTVANERENFIQCLPRKEGVWPVDLMLVRDSTFNPMCEAAREVEMYGVRLRIPSLENLLALKLHALKHGHAGRYFKDLLDVEALVRANGLDMRSERMRQLFLKYGTLKIYEQYPDSRPARNPEIQEAAVTPDLEFPIDPGFVSLPPRFDPQVMLRRIAETMPWRSTRPGEAERRRAAAVDFEFIL